MMKNNFTFNAKCINFYSMVSAFCILSPQIMKIASYVHSQIFYLTGIFVHDIVNQLYFFTLNTQFLQCYLLKSCLFSIALHYHFC